MLRYRWPLVTAVALVPGVVFAIAWLVVVLPVGFAGQDINRLLQAGARWTNGESIYADPSYLYSPLAAIVVSPAALLPTISRILWIVLKCVVIAWVGWTLNGRHGAVQALFFVPFISDLHLGNANAILVGAMMLALRDRYSSGIPLGIASAAIPKPFLLPFMIWLCAKRKQSAVGVVMAGIISTALGIMVAGPSTYVSWLVTLQDAGRFAAPSVWNQGLTGVAPQVAFPVAVASIIGLLLALRLASERESLAWAIAAGILAAPYAGTLSALTFIVLGPTPALLFLGSIALMSPPLAALMLLGWACIGTRGEIGLPRLARSRVDKIRRHPHSDPASSSDNPRSEHETHGGDRRMLGYE